MTARKHVVLARFITRKYWGKCDDKACSQEIQTNGEIETAGFFPAANQTPKTIKGLFIITPMPLHKSIKYNEAIKFNSYTNILAINHSGKKIQSTKGELQRVS